MMFKKNGFWRKVVMGVAEISPVHIMDPYLREGEGSYSPKKEKTFLLKRIPPFPLPYVEIHDAQSHR